MRLRTLDKHTPILAEDMNAPTSFLTNLIQSLRSYSQQDVQSLWHGLYEDSGGNLATAMTQGEQWPLMELNDRQHIAWSRGRGLWLYQRLTVPNDIGGYALTGLTLRLAVTWWAEDAQLYVNGEFAQAGDLFDFFTRFCLSEAVIPGQVFEVVLRLVSPTHDAGALVRSQLIYEAPNHPLSPEPGFVADELQVLQYYLQTLAPEKLATVETLITKAWQASRGELHQRLAQLRQCLLPYGDWLKQRQIHCVGHAHLDLAWLWPVAETWQAAERTFESVLALQQDFPELTYTHSSPALFAWLEHHRPQLFSQIQQQVTAGTWSIDAGLWVEPELNIVSGEAIARQILYGQRYCQEKFGTRSLIAWLPDTFGFCSQLPQLLKLGGVEVFATQKLRWNDTTQFPHDLFRWQAPDGSEVLGWTLPPIGTDFDPVQMAEYAVQWEQKTHSLHTCWLPGVGDHGGGPTRDMLLKARRWRESPFFPQVNFSTPPEFLTAVLGTEASAVSRQPSAIQTLPTGQPSRERVGWAPPTEKITQLPLWNNELYLELHRGCYTAHSDQKQHNRRGEDLLYQAEVWSTVAQLVTGQPYPQETLTTAWQGLLFNQFHDILPGSSIPAVFEDANRQWAQVNALGQTALNDALAALSAQVGTERGRPVLVFNTHGWPCSDVVDVAVPVGQWQLIDGETNQPVASVVQERRSPWSDHEPPDSVLSFVAHDVPAVGYRLYALVADQSPMPPGTTANIEGLETETETQTETETEKAEFILENSQLRIAIATETGEITSCLHLATGREILRAAANQLQCFEDSGQYWDAWNIDPDYAAKPCAPAQLLGIEWIARNAVCQCVRVTRQLNQSTVVQEYRLAAGSPLLQVETWVDWQETQVVLKVNFPLTVASDHATYEVPFGAIERSTQPTTDSEQAKWEVPALRWADISGEDSAGEFGLSILTDCKHGFDAQPSQLRLTLLKAPLWPDPGCDRGHHHFTYAIYPHPGNWQTARTPHHAQLLNMPLRAYLPATRQPLVPQAARRSFLQLDSDHLILSAFKPSETDPTSFIARYYDAYGIPFEETIPPLTNSLGLATGEALNVLEEPMDERPHQPYQIQTRCLYREAP